MNVEQSTALNGTVLIRRARTRMHTARQRLPTRNAAPQLASRPVISYNVP